MPGIGAAYLFWGAASSSVPFGIALCLLGYAVVYAAPAFIVLIIFKLLAQTLRTKDAA